MIHTDKKENKSNMNHSAKATTEKKRAGKTEETNLDTQKDGLEETEETNLDTQKEGLEETEETNLDTQKEGLEETEETNLDTQKEGLEKLKKSFVAKDYQSKTIQKNKIDLAKKVTVLEESLVEEKNQFMRLAADFDNYKKRQQQQNISHLKYAVESMAKNLFKVTDSLENALKHIEQEKDDSRLEEFVAGIKLVQQQFLDVFKQHHIERFHDLGKPFNPNRHEAIGTIETEDVEHNQVIDVLTPGYLFHDKVIRTAMVQVSKKKES